MGEKVRPVIIYVCASLQSDFVRTVLMRLTYYYYYYCCWCWCHYYYW